MPILADALQDAGCDDEAILGHSRDEKATHVRGCWLVDLVFGKSGGAAPACGGLDPPYNRPSTHAQWGWGEWAKG